MVLLAAAVFINYVDRGAMPTAAHLLQDELSLSPRELGVLFGAFFWSYALLQIPAGYLAERFGALPVLACGLIVWAAATMLVGAAHSFGYAPCAAPVARDWRECQLSLRIEIARCGSPGGQISAAPTGSSPSGICSARPWGHIWAGALLDSYGWRPMFWTFGALSLLWLIPWAGLKSRSRAAVLGAAGSPALRSLLRQRSLWGTSLAHFSANYTYYFMLTWLPLYLVKERGFSTAAMAAITGSAYLVNAFSALLGGWILDRAVSRIRAHQPRLQVTCL